MTPRGVPGSVEECEAACAKLNLELLTVELKRPEIGAPSLRAIVPGLRPLWPRFAPGRLYAVPVSLGWRRRRASERALNPVPIIY